MAAIAGLWLLTGCGRSTPEGIDPIEGFEVERYMGRWYEIARLDHRFERGMEQVTAHYTLQPDGTVEVVNRGFETADRRWQEARGKARFVGSPDVGALEVSFFGPFYGGYNIVDLDPAYQHALVAGPDRSYLWILSRTPQPPREAVERLVARAASLGFDTPSLIYVRH
ncbi:MAG TPA: lipocalin family protein [Steroidobacteraceae bacterium]|nr:lipocalin family protein [Steroidobacteraceae bacterium]